MPKFAILKDSLTEVHTQVLWNHEKDAVSRGFDVLNGIIKNTKDRSDAKEIKKAIEQIIKGTHNPYKIEQAQLSMSNLNEKFELDKNFASKALETLRGVASKVNIR